MNFMNLNKKILENFYKEVNIEDLTMGIKIKN